jgi:DNA-3-methyladenine glycosylase I
MKNEIGKNRPVRCDWCLGSEIYVDYHDREWGVPVHDDRVHFEFLVLESAQAGLSWLTILRRRENYRKAYSDFDPEKVASYDQSIVEKLLHNEGIIRNRKKIESSVTNAQNFLKIVDEFGTFDRYIWRFTDGKVIKNAWKSVSQLPANTPLSATISKDLKQRGFRFLGTTIIYAHLQSIGIINDHLVDCFRYNQV